MISIRRALVTYEYELNDTDEDAVVIYILTNEVRPFLRDAILTELVRFRNEKWHIAG